MEFLSTSALTAAGVVLLVQEVLKLKIVPVGIANRYPVPTNIVLSLIAALFVVPADWTVTDPVKFLVQVGTIAVVAAIAYNQLIAKWAKPYEG